MKACLKSINITPPVGMQMAGYSERDHGAEGIHDELFAKILVLDDGRKKIAMVNCDVIGIDLYVTGKVRSMVAKATDIAEDAVMICAIHTHSSVFACRLHGMDFLHTKRLDEVSDEAYYQQLIQKIANGIIWANAELKEARIGYGSGTVEGLATNRNDPKAYYDNQVGVLKICDEAGDIMGILVNHACHPTVLNQHNYLFSADYVSYFCKKLNEVYPKAVIVFSQGAAGSASTRYTKKGSTFDEAKRLGELLAAAAQNVIPDIKMEQDCSFQARCADLTLQVKKFPSPEESLLAIRQYEQRIEELKRANAPESEIRKAYVTLQGAQREYHTSSNVEVTSVTTMMQLLDLGVCTFVSVPGDVFGEIGRDIKRLACDDSIVVCGYTNDFVGYIVSNEGYEMDCYEKNMTIFDADSHARILHVAQQLYHGN